MSDAEAGFCLSGTYCPVESRCENKELNLGDGHETRGAYPGSDSLWPILDTRAVWVSATVVSGESPSVEQVPTYLWLCCLQLWAPAFYDIFPVLCLQNFYSASCTWDAESTWSLSTSPWIVQELKTFTGST